MRMLLTRKLLKQGFRLVKVKSSLRKCDGRHHDLINSYVISVSQWPLICSTYCKHFPVEDTKREIKIVHQRTDNTMAKRKSTKRNTTIYKTYIYSQRSSNMSPTKDRGELGCFRRVCRSCSISGTRRVNLVTNQIITREWVRNREVLTISGTKCYSTFGCICMFYRSLYFFLYFFFSPLCCLFFDVRFWFPF
jgi:hypothetical protein